ncbi:MAG TPA: SDR family NAD(P)-dependent oxidoreductase [Saprospiraceae bacterium]|nr:SDR family NAD(P)-dependent oxidoreductase [Saprospiraceae bacterium]
MNSTQKICLVTGGTSGVGKATAVGLAGKDMEVVLVSRHEEECVKTPTIADVPLKYAPYRYFGVTKTLLDM